MSVNYLFPEEFFFGTSKSGPLIISRVVGRGKSSVMQHF